MNAGAECTEALRAASRLTTLAGLAAPEGVSPLPGGRNNRVYRVDGPGGPWLLKRYFSHPGDARDRLGAEFAFLSYAASLGAPQTPRPLAKDRALGAALYEFVQGMPPTAGEIGWEHAEQALRFAGLLAAGRDAPMALALPEASEAYFSAGAHLEGIGRRVARLEGMKRRCGTDELAWEFCRLRLLPAWERVREQVLCQALAGEDEELPAAARCISPSDFGFHNTLVLPSGPVVFLDFEYAGWDDPAKLACDFFLQPRLPVPGEFMERFTHELAIATGFPGDLNRRARLLYPAYRIKWCCILLGEFLNVSGHRRRFALDGTDPEEAKRVQLAKAERMLAFLENT